MAYSINGKVYTEHPLMDEIVYNCKLILEGIMVKNDILATNLDTQEMIDEVEVYQMIHEGRISISLFPFTYEILKAFGYNYRLAKACLTNRDNIPEKDREKLLEFACNYFLDNFEEKNNYYRTLIGLPPYGTTTYDIYIDESYIPKGYTKEVDFSKPIHKLDKDIITILDGIGKLDEILESHRGSNYSYLRFMGRKSLDLYTVRKAGKWDILYMPPAEELVSNRFRELYNLNKEIYLKRTYQEAYVFGSEYYDQCMILLVLCQTFADMVVDVPEWYIRRDIFDIRSVKYFLDSNGVDFYKEIPLKYQIRIVKNLNKLIKYKSSDKNCLDILDVFALKNTSIYEYFLFKKRLTDSRGHYIKSDKEDQKYELEFVQSKINDTFDNYIKDMIYRTPYDDITYQDKYWDGEDTHQYIKDLHLNRDFTIEGTKYMSIEYKNYMSEYLFQVQFFLGLLLDSTIDTNDITIPLPSLLPSVQFKVSNLFLFLILMTLNYDESSTKIIKPEDIEEIFYTRYDAAGNLTSERKEKPKFKKYDDFDGGYSHTKEEEYGAKYSANGGKAGDYGSVWYLNGDGGNHVEYSEIKSVEDFYDWMKRQYPEMFIVFKNRVFGYNTKVDLDKISEVISRRHSQFQFEKGFTLEDLGVEDYIIPEKISSIEELLYVYENNNKCYNTLKHKMVYEADDRDEFKLMEFVFNSLFTKEFDYGFNQIDNGTKEASTLEEIFIDRDYTLYMIYKKIISETNIETRRDNIRNIMNDVINTLEYYLSGEGLEYIFSFTTVASFSALIHYIYLMITFFKSYKVYFLDPYVTLVADDRLENNAKGYDTIAEKKIDYFKEDKQFQRDIFEKKVHLDFEDHAHYRVKETIDVYGHFEADPFDDYDYDGMYAVTEKVYDEYKDANGGYADPKSCIPFIMLNAGRAQGSRRDLWDLNGANAMEMSEYVDIDGGHVFQLDDYRKDYWGTHFVYDINGGGPSTNQFFTKTMHVKVEDNQIEASVRISTTEYNYIEEKEDGLYLKSAWADWTDLADFEKETEDSFEQYVSLYNEIISDILITDDTEIDNKINRCITATVNRIEQITNYHNKMDDAEARIKGYTDKRAEELKSMIDNMDPSIWGIF